eukprot:CAMPEP_0170445010 /NCGR_PEP_ID=MMETSP0117_2-20130122/48837_1 /TAXON_ID=400756 /ORGANISM="Durinskia baltica, Strain CSIRO CS-38" /LENGTH=40 /DNA_ID= /DNA_START= /DNA_END= /DNA_ORIENTATION=
MSWSAHGSVSAAFGGFPSPSGPMSRSDAPTPPLASRLQGL